MARGLRSEILCTRVASEIAVAAVVCRRQRKIAQTPQLLTQHDPIYDLTRNGIRHNRVFYSTHHHSSWFLLPRSSFKRLTTSSLSLTRMLSSVACLSRTCSKVLFSADCLWSHLSLTFIAHHRCRREWRGHPIAKCYLQCDEEGSFTRKSLLLVACRYDREPLTLIRRSSSTASTTAVTRSLPPMTLHRRSRASALLTSANGTRNSSRLIKRCFSRSSLRRTTWISRHSCKL